MILLPLRHALAFVAIVLMARVATPVAAAPAEIPGPRAGKWAHEYTTLAPDPRVVWGRLDNGVRYALLPHRGVPGSVAMRLVMLSGSVDETDSERGIAHFVEHMVFRGTRRFKYEEMVGFFQKLGMEYGSDVNAVTSFDYTAYMLDFRDNDRELLHQGLMLLRDFTDSANFDSGYIEHERGVILSELRLRSGGLSGENMASYLPLVFRGTRIQDRSPGGLPEQVRTFTREQFLAFYRRCYRPDLAVVVIVGDIDVAATTELVREEFGAIAARTDPVPPRQEGKLDTRKALRATVLPISDVGGIEVSATSVIRPPSRPDSLERQIERQRRTFVTSLLSDRIEQTLPGGEGASYNVLMGLETAEARAAGGPEDWDATVTGLDEVIRVTYESGFTAREIEQLKRHYTMLSTFMIEQAATMDPTGLASELVDTITEHTVFTGFEQTWRTFFDWLGRVTPQDLLQTFRNCWDLERMAFHITGETEIKGGEATVLKRIAEVRKGKMRTLRLETRDESVFTLLKWGTPTPVVERSEVPELGAKMYRFGNNVRLNFIPRRNEPGLVQAFVRVGNGVLDMPGNQPALKEFALQTLLASGAGRYTSEQIGEIVSDHMLGFSIDLEDHDAFTFRGYTRAEDFRAFLGVTTEFLHKPRFDTYLHRSVKLLAAIQRVIGGFGMGEGVRELEDYLFKGDARFTWGTVNNYLGMSVLDVRNWIQPQLTGGYLEVTVVGDIEEKTVIDLVSRTLGSLPVRAATKVMARPPAPVTITAPAGFQRIEFVGEQHQGMVIGTWPVQGATAVRDSIAVHVLGRVMDIRIREQVRDNLGLAYSPSTQFDEFDGFPGFGLLQTVVDCSPADSTRIAELIASISASAAKSGVTPGEFQGALGVFKSQIRRAFLENGFLLKQFSRAQESPQSIDDLIAASKDLFDTITIEEVNAWAAKILPAANCRTAAIVPKPFVGILQTGAKP
jgi:zinc protease